MKITNEQNTIVVQPWLSGKLSTKNDTNREIPHATQLRCTESKGFENVRFHARRTTIFQFCLSAVLDELRRLHAPLGVGGDEDIGGRELPTSKLLRKLSTGLTIFLSAPDQALPSSLLRSFFKSINGEGSGKKKSFECASHGLL
jgi:hypothetical protein